MSYLSDEQIQQIGFAHVGTNVKISSNAVFYQPELQSFGDNSRIDDFCVVSGKIQLGRNVHIAVFSNLAGGIPGITMEDFSGVAYGCQVFAQSDDYSGNSLTNPTVPKQFKTELFSEVIIERHAILGTNCVVAPGVRIAEGGAFIPMSFVQKNTLPWSLYGGSPARKIAERSQNLLQLELDYLNSETN